MSVAKTSEVWESPAEVKGAQLIVLLKLADWANDEGRCWCALPHLAEKARMSVRHAARMLEQLEEELIIYFDKRGHGRGATHELRLHTHRLGWPMAARITEAIALGERARRPSDPAPEGPDGAPPAGDSGGDSGGGKSDICDRNSDMVSDFPGEKSRTSDPESRTFETESRTFATSHKDKRYSTLLNKGARGGADGADPPLGDPPERKALLSASLDLFGEQWTRSWTSQCDFAGCDPQGVWHFTLVNGFARDRLDFEYSKRLGEKMGKSIRFHLLEEWARNGQAILGNSDMVSGNTEKQQAGG